MKWSQKSINLGDLMASSTKYYGIGFFDFGKNIAEFKSGKNGESCDANTVVTDWIAKG